MSDEKVMLRMDGGFSVEVTFRGLKRQLLEAAVNPFGGAFTEYDWHEAAITTTAAVMDTPHYEERILFAVALVLPPLPGEDLTVSVVVSAKTVLSVPYRWLSTELRMLSAPIHIGGTEAWCVEVRDANDLLCPVPELVWRTLHKPEFR